MKQALFTMKTINNKVRGVNDVREYLILRNCDDLSSYILIQKTNVWYHSGGKIEYSNICTFSKMNKKYTTTIFQK